MTVTPRSLFFILQKLLYSLSYSAIIVAGSFQSSIAQPFQKAVGVEGFEKGSTIKLTHDGGFIIAGETQSYGLKERDMLLIKTDSNGNVLWKKTYGGAEREVVTDVIQTPDKGFILLAEKYQPNMKEGEFLTLIKTNEAGTVQWKKIFDEGGHETEGFSIQATPDGGYIMTGVVKKLSVLSSAFFTMVGEAQSLYVLKVDGNGNKLWSKIFMAGAEGSISTGASVAVSKDGSLLITGNISRKPADDKYAGAAKEARNEMAVNMLLLKIDPYGKLDWAKEFEGKQITAGGIIIEKGDGGFAVAGVANLTTSDLDLMISTFDAAGNLQWAKTYGGLGLESSPDIAQTPEGGFVVSAITESFGSGSSDILLFKTDKSGNVLWSKAYGGKSEEYSSRLALTSDGIVMAGSTASFASESFDVLFLKTDHNGNSGCLGTTATLNVSNFQLTTKRMESASMQNVEQAISPPNMKKANVNNIIEINRQIRVKELCE